jgi:DNA-binding FadR family transcriptional regulator
MRNRNAALEQMRQWLASGEWAIDSRVPPERDLAETLGVSRGVLRLALATLESEGHIWRHVGKGTFVGPRPPLDGTDLATLANRTSPAEVIETRLILEPNAARLAAMHATTAQIAEMRQCIIRTRAARTFQQYVIWDNRLHLAIAGATRNSLLMVFLETLHAVRRSVIWARLREKEPPRADNPSLKEHDDIIDAIESRDPDRAAQMMLNHLMHVQSDFLPKQYWGPGANTNSGA